MISDIVRLVRNRSLSTTAICEKLTCSEKELREAIAAHPNTNVRIVDSMVSAKQKIGQTAPLASYGDARPGRKLVPIMTDIHFGSAQCMERDVIRFATKAWKMMDQAGQKGERVLVCTGDILDGNKPILLPDQKYIGFDHQVERAVRTFQKCPPFTYLVVDGNHDGYYSASIGCSSGDILQDRMRAAGVNWTHLGACLGRAQIHGAAWQLWHPHGGAGTRNAIRRILNARIEATPEHTDVLAIGHFHKFTTVAAYPERTFGVAGGCFQKKGSEFSNRLNSGWDVGGTMVSYEVTGMGNVKHQSAEFYPVAGSEG